MREAIVRWRTIGVVGLLVARSTFASAQDSATAEQLLKDLACGACHEGIPVETDIREKAPDLSQAGLRYGPDHLLGFLRFPVKIRQQIGASRMPNFGLDEREAFALTLFLLDQVPAGVERPVYSLQDAYDKARSAYPEVTAANGAEIFRSLNCLACHKQSSFTEWEGKNGPDLEFEGARVTREWLHGFLAAPRPVRPFGFYPGSGSRHPDFRLAQSEIETLTAYLVERRGDFDTVTLTFEPKDLHPFSMEKAETLIKQRLPCLGCHRLGGEGGRIGPDLSSLKTRLTTVFAYRIIKDPLSFMPETAMPRVEMPPATLELIVNYLMQQNAPRDSAPYASLVERRPYFFQGLGGGRELYVRYCAACHGLTGEGDGYNAEFLPTVPTKHADSAYMSTRPDDTLFDGIYAGGYVLNKSNRMPPWGFTLERPDIRRLVAYLRELCGCEGPAWSRR